MSLFHLFNFFTGTEQQTQYDDPMELDDEPVLLYPDEFLNVKSAITPEVNQFHLRMLRNLRYRHVPHNPVETERLFGNPQGQITRSRNGKEDGPGWYNDEIITAFMKGLESRSRGKVAVVNSLEVADKSFLTKLRDKKSDLNRLRQAQSILCPISINDNHFGLIIIKNEKTDFKITCIDSKNWLQTHNPFLDFAKRLVHLLHGKNIHLVSQSMSVPMQKGSHDCGPAACFYAQAHCRGEDIEKYANYAKCVMDYSPQRKEVVKLLYETSLPPVKGYMPIYKKTRNNSDDCIIVSPPSPPRSGRSPHSPRRISCKA